MKKLNLITSVILTLIACSAVEDTAENIINSRIEPVEQDITEEVTIEATELQVAGEITQTTTIDTADINEQINDIKDTGAVTINDITLDDLTLTLLDDSEQTNFDFLDSLVIVISSGEGSDPITIDFGEIEKGLNSLTLPEGASTSILSLIEGDEVNELTIDFEMVTNAAVEHDIQLELVSTLLADLEINL